MQNLKSLLELMNEKNASDLHLSIGSPPRMRINGQLNPIDDNKLNAEQIKKLLQEYLSDEQLQNIIDGNEFDFTIGIPGLSRFRVNAFKQRGSIVAAFRRLPFEVPNIQNLGFSETILKLLVSIPSSINLSLRISFAFSVLLAAKSLLFR